MSRPAADDAASDPDPLTPSRRRNGWIWAGVAACVGVIALVVLARWGLREASWPKELDDPPTALLFTNVEQPTAEDLVLLEELVGEIAIDDPIVLGLLDGRPWPDPVVRPVFWTKSGAGGRSVLIGGSFDLDLDGGEYHGPWLTTGCRRGSYRGTVRTADVFGLHQVGVTVDLTFERVADLSIPPSQPGTTTIRYHDDARTAPWYTGHCPFFSLPD